MHTEGYHRFFQGHDNLRNILQTVPLTIDGKPTEYIVMRQARFPDLPYFVMGDGINHPFYLSDAIKKEWHQPVLEYQYRLQVQIKNKVHPRESAPLAERELTHVAKIEQYDYAMMRICFFNRLVESSSRNMMESPAISEAKISVLFFNKMLADRERK